MKRKDLLGLFNTLNTIGAPKENANGATEQGNEVALNESSLMSAKFKYAIAKNLRILLPEVQALLIAGDSSRKYKEFEALSVELAKKHVKKDDTGEPIKADGRVEFEDNEKAEKEFEELKEKYKEVMEENDIRQKQYNELLESEANISIHKVNTEELPSFLSVSQLYAIIEMVDGDIEMKGTTC